MRARFINESSNADIIGDKKIYANKEMIVIVENKKIVGVLTTVNDKIAKVAGEKGNGTLMYYAALALRNGIRPNKDNVTDAASKIWEYKFQNFPKTRLTDYDHKKEFLNYKYMPPNEEFVKTFKEKTQNLGEKVEKLGWTYVEKKMKEIYGEG